MSRRLIIVLPQNINNIIKRFEFLNDDYIIGVEKGLIILKENNIRYNHGIGDFDSVNNNELEIINNMENVISLNPIKDDTDLLAALKSVDLKEFNEIYVLGGILGSRADHFYSNILLLKKYNFIMIDDNNLLFKIEKSIEIDNKYNYKYISFFGNEEVLDLTLKGFKYNINNYKLDCLNTIGISNEIVDEKCYVSFSSGSLICMMSN